MQIINFYSKIEKHMSTCSYNNNNISMCSNYLNNNNNNNIIIIIIIIYISIYIYIYLYIYIYITEPFETFTIFHIITIFKKKKKTKRNCIFLNPDTFSSSLPLLFRLKSLSLFIAGSPPALSLSVPTSPGYKYNLFYLSQT